MPSSHPSHPLPSTSAASQVALRVRPPSGALKQAPAELDEDDYAAIVASWGNVRPAQLGSFVGLHLAWLGIAPIAQVLGFGVLGAVGALVGVTGYSLAAMRVERAAFLRDQGIDPQLARGVLGHLGPRAHRAAQRRAGFGWRQRLWADRSARARYRSELARWLREQAEAAPAGPGR